MDRKATTTKVMMMIGSMTRCDPLACTKAPSANVFTSVFFLFRQPAVRYGESEYWDERYQRSEYANYEWYLGYRLCQVRSVVSVVGQVVWLLIAACRSTVCFGSAFHAVVTPKSFKSDAGTHVRSAVSAISFHS
jgi:hypothetical protein